MWTVKRVYDSAGKDDGYRVLVDRLWPRGLSKARARVDLWLRDIAPTDALRKWFAHDPVKWAEFQKRYRAELRKNKDAVSRLRRLQKGHGKVTLLFAAHDADHNQAVVLRAFLK
jgi:uncharacterized protein YeaO (DUF488 family)